MKSTWKEKWIEDIDYLRDILKEKHNNLFAYTSEEDFNENIDILKNIINELDYEEMKVEISRIVASVKDAHTSMIFPAKRFLPIKFYWFEDGVYIIDTTKEYEHLLFKRVIGLEDSSIEDVLNDLSSIISFENEYFFKAQSMKYMQIAEVLYGLLICEEVDMIKVILEDGEFDVCTVFSEGLVYTNKKLPLYAKNSFENLWFKELENKELYIKYNSCRECGEKTIKNKIEDIIDFIESNSIERLTIDLRNNLGGNSTLLDPFIDYLIENKRLNKKENLKVIIGRETFSSALLNAYRFKHYTNANIMGEPSGGKPNCYGEILSFILPNSRLKITYSTRFYKIIEDDSIMALYPDEIILESIDDYKLIMEKS